MEIDYLTGKVTSPLCPPATPRPPEVASNRPPAFHITRIPVQDFGACPPPGITGEEAFNLVSPSIRWTPQHVERLTSLRSVYLRCASIRLPVPGTCFPPAIDPSFRFDSFDCQRMKKEQFPLHGKPERFRPPISNLPSFKKPSRETIHRQNYL